MLSSAFSFYEIVQVMQVMSLKDAVKSEVRIDIVLEESPEYESKSNGEVEKAIQMVQGQFRTMKDRLESKYNQRIGGEHPCVPWLGGTCV